MLWLFSAFATADLSSFATGSLAALGVCFRIAIAVAAGLLRMRSSTIWTFRGEMRAYLR
jgi:hypothetical protein